MSTLQEIKSIEDCSTRVEHAFKQSPEELFATIDKVVFFIRSIPNEVMHSNESKIYSLEKKMHYYTFQGLIQKMRRDHADGKQIYEDFYAIMHLVHKRLVFINISMTESMAKQLLKLGEETGEICDPTRCFSMTHASRCYTRERFVEDIKEAHGIDLDSPFIILLMIQKVVSLLFNSSSEKTDQHHFYQPAAQPIRPIVAPVKPIPYTRSLADTSPIQYGIEHCGLFKHHS